MGLLLRHYSDTVLASALGSSLGSRDADIVVAVLQGSHEKMQESAVQEVGETEYFSLSEALMPVRHQDFPSGPQITST